MNEIGKVTVGINVESTDVNKCHFMETKTGIIKNSGDNFYYVFVNDKMVFKILQGTNLSWQWRARFKSELNKDIDDDSQNLMFENLKSKAIAEVKKYDNLCNPNKKAGKRAYYPWT